MNDDSFWQQVAQQEQEQFEQEYNQYLDSLTRDDTQ